MGNNQRDYHLFGVITIRADFHVHTVYSPDSLLKLEDLIQIASKSNLDCIAVTDHNTIAGARRLAGLEPSCRVIVGEEVLTSDGEIIGLFLKEEIPSGLDVFKTIQLIKDQEALVVLPHSCDRLRRHTLSVALLEEVVPEIDFIEGFNGRAVFGQDNLMSERLARRFEKPLIAGSDSHTSWELGRSGMELNNFETVLEFKKAVSEAVFFGERSPFWVHAITKIVKYANLSGLRNHDPRQIIEDSIRCMELAGYKTTFPEGVPVILKNNISWHFPYPGANTTPWQLEACIKALQDSGYDMVCVENRTVVTNAFKGERLNKYVGVLQKYGIETKYNFRPSDMKWVIYQPKAKMLALDRIFPEGIKIPDFFIGKSIIHLPTTKCHIYTQITGAMKNAFGGLLNTKRHYCHSQIHETLVDLLAIQKEIHPGIFTLMDGKTAGNGPGPRTMIPVCKDYMLASSDSVAIDAISAKMMGFDPLSLPFIRLAHERGLGIGDPRQIEVIGEDIDKVNYEFSVGDNTASRIGDLLWFGPLKHLQKLCFHTPLVYFFVFGSYFYHDLIWYPIRGKKIVNAWQKETSWGRLFSSYK